MIIPKKDVGFTNGLPNSFTIHDGEKKTKKDGFNSYRGLPTLYWA